MKVYDREKGDSAMAKACEELELCENFMLSVIMILHIDFINSFSVQTSKMSKMAMKTLLIILQEMLTKII